MLFSVTAAKREDTGAYVARLDRPREHVRLVAIDRNAVFAAGRLLWRRGSTLVAQRFDPDRLQLSGEPRPVTDPVGSSAFKQMALAASASGVLFYGASGGATQQLTWFDRAGKSAGTLGPSGEYAAFALSPDGRRVAVSKFRDSGSDLWIMDVERDVSSRLTFAPGLNTSPVSSPDGRTVLFNSGSPQNLFRKDSSGAGAEERIAESGNVQIPTDWSRDGRTLMYYEFAQGTNRDLWVLPVTPDGKPEAGAKPYLRAPFNERFGRFSPEPNPRWVAYESDETGRFEIYVQAYPEPKGKWLVSSGGGQFPAWGPGGRELFYLSADSKLMAAKLKVVATALQALTPSALFEVGDDGNFGSPFAVAPDGQRFLVAVPIDEGTQPLEVIVNWTALLKKGSE